MNVLFLYGSYRGDVFKKIKSGEVPRHGFWGMIYLQELGIRADYLEIEQFFPRWFCRILRKILNVYFIHIPILWKIFSYDIVFTSTAFGTQFLRSLLPFKKPLWIMHDFNITGFLGKERTWRQKIFSFMVSKCAGIVTLSRDEKERLEARFPHLRGKIKLIPFGVDLDFFRPLAVKEEKQILAPGFDPDRDWKTLLEAVRDLDVKVILATRIERVKPFLPLPSSVEVKNFSNRELVREYAKSLAVVLPLDTSGRNNDAMGCSTLFEAMAMGKPVVATRTRAMETYVTDGENGFLVEEKNPSKMRDKILKLLQDEFLRKKIGQNARKYAIRNLDARICAASLADFFRRLKNP